MARIDPTRIDRINEHALSACSPGKQVAPINIQDIVIAEDALDALAEITEGLCRDGPAVMVADRTPMTRGPDDLKALVEAKLAHGMRVKTKTLPEDGAGELHADLPAATRLAKDLTEAGAVVAVGSGSICDVAKYGTFLAAKRTGRDLPFICFPTAASVTAYTSAIAVLSSDGVKRNFPARLPHAIVCDLRALADAPATMTQAGFGDVLARSVAYGDWYLAGELGMDDSFNAAAGHLLEPAEQHMIQMAEAVAECHLDGIRSVTEALLMAGMAMAIVSQTAPISGWEHVISHYLDMTAPGDGRAMALHGAQVGVATLIVARAYEQTWDSLDLDRIRTGLRDGEDGHHRQLAHRVFAPYDKTGAMVEEIWREFGPKLQRWCDNADARRRFADRKQAGEFDTFMKRSVRTSEAVQQALTRAGAPQRFAELTAPIDLSAVHNALQYAYLVRSRFTLGDLLTYTGWLEPEAAWSLLDEPGM